MFKNIYWKIYDYIKSLFCKSARHNQEFINQSKPMKEVLKNIEDTLNKTKEVKTLSKRDDHMMCLNIRFESLKSGHNLGKLTSEEEIEFENMLTINMFDLRPWTRQRLGMRMCYFK